MEKVQWFCAYGREYSHTCSVSEPVLCSDVLFLESVVRVCVCVKKRQEKCSSILLGNPVLLYHNTTFAGGSVIPPGFLWRQFWDIVLQHTPYLSLSYNNQPLFSARPW